MTNPRRMFFASRAANQRSRRKMRVVSRRSPKRSRQRQSKSPSLPVFRLFLVWIVLASGILGLAWRMYQLQIVQGTELAKKARVQQTVNLRPYIPRRSIIDAQGNIVATDRVVHSLYAHPKLFKLPQEDIAAKLSLILEGKTPEQLIERFNQRETGIRIAYDLSEAVSAQINALSLDGLELIEHYARVYPHQEMVADVVGYVDRDHLGQAGIERSQRNLLERDPLSYHIRRTGNGMIMPAYLPKDGLKSNDWQLQLTLDLRLQRAARAALKQQLQHYKAKRGAVIVMDAMDGSLVSLVCEPTYNPNEYHKADISLFKNWAVSDLYEPGSTFKPINVAIALNEGVIQPNTIVHDSGSVSVDGWDIYNASKTGYGAIDIAKVLQTSSNVGMIQIMRKLTKDTYYERLRELGLGEPSSIDLPGEVAGHLKSKAIFTERSIELATTSFGQGFSLTPIKLVQLHAALANGGKLVTPHVVKGLVDATGNLHWQPNYPQKQVFSAQASRQVVEMMETVVSEGTGEPAKIDHYRIGGKTGTAQKAGPRGGYLPNAKITSFVAILPIDNPRYVVLAVVDEPQGGNTFGSTVAAPIVKTVMEALISVKGIPPSQN